MARFSHDVTTKSIKDVNEANRAAFGAGGAGETDWKATNARFGYGNGYPESPQEGLGPINSVAAMQRANAKAYGPASSFESPTNMVGDAKHAKDCAVHTGGQCDCTMTGDDDQKVMKKVIEHDNGDVELSSEPSQYGDSGAAISDGAAELAREMAKLRESQPRPIAKMYGSRGPTPEQEAAWNEANRSYNNKMSKLRKEHKSMMERKEW